MKYTEMFQVSDQNWQYIRFLNNRSYQNFLCMDDWTNVVQKYFKFSFAFNIRFWNECTFPNENYMYY